MELQTPRVETGLVLYSSLASFSSPSYFPIPSLIFPGITFQITYLHSPPCSWGNLQQDTYLHSSRKNFHLNSGDRLISPFNINSIVYMSSEVPQGQFQNSELLWSSLDGKWPFWYNSIYPSLTITKGIKPINLLLNSWLGPTPFILLNLQTRGIFSVV